MTPFIIADKSRSFHMTLGLLELSLDMPLGMKDVFLELILQQCPNLVSLSISALRWIVPRASTRPLIGKSGGDSGRPLPALPLRSLQLYSLDATPGVLVSYLSRLENLRELSLQDIWDGKLNGSPARRWVQRPGTANNWEDSHSDEYACRELWLSVAHFCPQLLSIRYNIDGVIRCPVPIELFPRVEAWGIDFFLVALNTRTWADLKVRSIENRLTTLEILREGPGSANWIPSAESWRDDIVYHFLRSSPSLVHFKAGGVNLSTVALWGIQSLGLLDAWLSETWACRGLKTLSLNLAQSPIDSLYDTTMKYSESNVRRAISYITHVCPQLQDLSIKIECPLFKLESGLCLLTRLSDLRRLSLSTESFRNEYSPQELFRKKDFAWIQGIEDSNITTAKLKTLTPESVSTSSTGSTFRTLSGFLRKEGRGPLLRTLAAPEKEVSSLQDGLRDCLKMAQELSESEPRVELLTPSDLPLEDHRARIRQQQDRGCCSTDTADYNLEPPVGICKFDGLYNMDYCGTYLELEAHFQARLFAMSDEGKAKGRTPKRPWPKMKQLILSNGRLFGNSKILVKEQADFVQQLLRELRPDIDISCPCSEKPHFLLDI